MDNELGLAETIAVVRSELRKAQDAGSAGDVRFSVASVEVDLAVEIVKTGGGDVSIKVLGILSVGGKGEVSTGFTNTVKVVLNPIGVDGEPFEVASARSRRPDAAAEGNASSADEAGGRPGG